MKTELLAESIFSLVIHGVGTKAQIVSIIAEEIEKHYEPVSDSYKSEEEISKKWCEHWKNYWVKTQTEPRTCETCTNEWDALTKEEMWDTIQRIRELTGNDGTESPERTVARLVEERPATPRHVSAEDVETIMRFINGVIAHKDGNKGIDEMKRHAKYCLDRIAGKGESR
ncbi:MAG TPA: hypothetical protein VLH56_18685 [Dissulfurispiraceae bacterium]|nr:hypothetical protein [Dissulfurispiraceae bacterium]